MPGKQLQERPKTLLFYTAAIVEVFRSVGPRELLSIRQTGTFKNLPGLEGKYFTSTASAAASFARQAVRHSLLP